MTSLLRLFFVRCVFFFVSTSVSLCFALLVSRLQA